MPTHAISFKVSTEEKKRLKHAAIDADKTISDWIHDTVFAALDANQKSSASSPGKKTTPKS